MGRPKKQHLKQRTDGRYTCRYKSMFFYGRTEEEAIEARDEYKKQEAFGQVISRKQLVNFARKWLPVAKANVAESTYAQYATLVEKLVRHLGEKEMNAITPLDIKEVYNSEFQNMSESYISEAKDLYAALFDSAIAEKICRQNPVRHSSAKPHHGTYKGHRAITPQEREWIETLCTDHRIHPFVITMLYSGLRPQEAKALDIDSAVDFKKEEIYVRQSVHIVDANHYEITDKVKTIKSARTVPLFPPVKKVLKGRHGYLITNADGSALTLSGWDRLWSSYVSSMERAINGCSKRWYGRRKEDKDKEELPQWISFKVRPYDLRHSFVSWGRDNGVELHTMVEWCGHSDAKMIMKIYDEVSESRSKAEAAKLTRKAFKKKKPTQAEGKKGQKSE